MTILLYKVDAENAQKILDFFDKNPDRNLCRVNLGNKQVAIFLRREIPRLKEKESAKWHTELG